MKTYFHVLLVVMFKTIQSGESLAGNNLKSVESRYLAILHRPRDPAIDDEEMPEVLSFCTGVVVSKTRVITVRQCFPQDEWFVFVVTEPYPKSFSIANSYRVKRTYDVYEMSVVEIEGSFKSSIKPLKIKQTLKAANPKGNCKIIGLKTPDGSFVTADKMELLIYNVWYTTGGAFEVPVRVLSYPNCYEETEGYISFKPLESHHFCIELMKEAPFEPCAFDRGAPIFCNDELAGLLLNRREPNDEKLHHLPEGCYGDMNGPYDVENVMLPKYRDIYAVENWGADKFALGLFVFSIPLVHVYLSL